MQYVLVFVWLVREQERERVCVRDKERERVRDCVYVSCCWPMRFLYLWLIMIKCLVAILRKTPCHVQRRERERDREREERNCVCVWERDGQETNQSCLWLMRDRERETDRERENFVRVYEYWRSVSSFCRRLSLSLSLKKKHLSQDGNEPLHHHA